MIQQNVDNKTQKEGSRRYINYLETISYATEYTEWYIQNNNQINAKYKPLCCHSTNMLPWQEA